MESLNYQLNVQSPRRHGIGKLQLAIEQLLGDGDIRIRVIKCATDFELGELSLRGNLSETIDREMNALAMELKEINP